MRCPGGQGNRNPEVFRLHQDGVLRHSQGPAGWAQEVKRHRWDGGTDKHVLRQGGRDGGPGKDAAGNP